MSRSLDTGRWLRACCCTLIVFVPIAGAQAKTETVLYSFQDNGADANLPVAGLISPCRRPD
jgi:hypothetical protein